MKLVQTWLKEVQQKSIPVRDAVTRLACLEHGLTLTSVASASCVGKCRQRLQSYLWGGPSAVASVNGKPPILSVCESLCLDCRSAFLKTSGSALNGFCQQVLDHEISGIPGLHAELAKIVGALRNWDSVTLFHNIAVGALAREALEFHWQDEVAIREITGLSSLDAAKSHLMLYGILHDIGKLHVKREILLSPSSNLSDEEFAEIGTHVLEATVLNTTTLAGSLVGEVLASGSVDREAFCDVLTLHHEWHDGSRGYHRGCPDDERCRKRLHGGVPRIASMFVILDSFDACRSERPYKSSISDKEAMEKLKANKGTQFAPDLFDLVWRWVH